MTARGKDIDVEYEAYVAIMWVNSCVISFTIAIFQDSLHQNNDALSIFPDPITILTESLSNPRCLATTECKVNDLGHG